MPSRPTSPPADQGLAAQHAQIAALESAFWEGGLRVQDLERYQAAYRELEAEIGARGNDRRHHFVIVIPVADNPRQLRSCLESLLTLCRTFEYGGRRQGRYHKVSVLLADDSTDPAAIAAHRAIARWCEASGITTHYFGSEQQQALLARLADLPLGHIVGQHAADAFGHKGQAMTRNIAYLKLAELQGQAAEPWLCYTVDADQVFEVLVETPDGGRRLCALNYLYHLDRVFAGTDIRVLTGKVVGDPPVSPAVMAGKFVDDVIGFMREMAASAAHSAYRQPGPGPGGAGDAAYHDMADLFGFAGTGRVYRYRCQSPGPSSNAQCLAEFARRLAGFFHGEHPTRTSWYRCQDMTASVQSARTVYTGNYVFAAAALDWFIPFAPLRLRMSGPTMGRMLRAALGAGFVSANLPMLHRRTLDQTGRSEFRPGVIAAAQGVDLSDEFERQFYGDVMLFALERLSGLGFPRAPLDQPTIAATLDNVRLDMRERYLSRRRQLIERLGVLRGLLRDPGQWWNQAEELAPARVCLEAFLADLEHNFGPDSTASARIEADQIWSDWRARQLQAIEAYRGDRQAWRRAVDRLRGATPA